MGGREEWEASSSRRAWRHGWGSARGRKLPNKSISTAPNTEGAGFKLEAKRGQTDTGGGGPQAQGAICCKRRLDKHGAQSPVGERGGLTPKTSASSSWGAPPSFSWSVRLYPATPGTGANEPGPGSSLPAISEALPPAVKGHGPGAPSAPNPKPLRPGSRTTTRKRIPPQTRSPSTCGGQPRSGGAVRLYPSIFPPAPTTRDPIARIPPRTLNPNNPGQSPWLVRPVFLLLRNPRSVGGHSAPNPQPLRQELGPGARAHLPPQTLNPSAPGVRSRARYDLPPHALNPAARGMVLDR